MLINATNATHENRGKILNHLDLCLESRSWQETWRREGDSQHGPLRFNVQVKRPLLAQISLLEFPVFDC